MNQTLPALDDVDLDTVYAIAISPFWSHWHHSNCPAPIRAWLNEHCPDVTVEAVSGWRGTACLDPYGQQIMNPDSFPQPMFRLGLSAEQAEEFSRYWSAGPGTETEDDFWFLIASKMNCFQPLELLDDVHFDLEISPWQPPQEDQRIDAV